MKNQFKVLLLMLITSIALHGQKTLDIEMDEKHTIFDKSFSTDNNTILVLNLKNTAAQVVASKDNSVHITYTKEFKNTRKKHIKRQLELLTVSGKKEGNKITYTTNSKNSHVYVNKLVWEDMLIGQFEKKNKDSIPKPLKRKSLDSLLFEIKSSDILYKNKLFGALKIKPRVKKWKSSDQLIITKMIIEIPEHIHVRATLENSNLVFLDDFYNRMTMNVRNTKIKFKSVGNPLNILDVDNGYFYANKIVAGDYTFANTKKVLIGEILNTKINTEFTKVEIGKIGKNTTIYDFNSKYSFYNFSENFGELKMNSDYSEINLFLPKQSEYYLETIGHNTVHFWRDIITEIPPSKKNMNSKMMEIGNKQNPNKISTHITNGIVRFGEDFIDFGED